jgi:hypothetical protein
MQAKLRGRSNHALSLLRGLHGKPDEIALYYLKFPETTAFQTGDSSQERLIVKQPRILDVFPPIAWVQSTLSAFLFFRMPETRTV